MSSECPRTCQAITHEPSCGCQFCKRVSSECKTATDDHFTPRTVQSLTKIKDTSENHQWLSQPCHTAKDRSTPLRKQVLSLERRGVIFTWEQHRTIFDNGMIPSTLASIITTEKIGRRRRRRHG